MLDPARARAEADAAERRGNGTLWAAGPVAWEGVSVGTVTQPEVVPSVEEGEGQAERAAQARVAPMTRAAAPPPHLDGAQVPTALLAAILARLEMAPKPAAEGPPAWLAEAIGDPLTYDAASSHRIDVCARVDPALYRRLQAMKERLGLRTTAGAWEYVLRAGLAASERRSACRLLC
jgi:hypothetical protein